MRALAIALIAGIGLAAAGPAAAQPWTDPAGRFVFQMPSGWREQVDARQTENLTYIEIFTPDRDCAFVAQPTEGLASISPLRARDVVLDDTRFGSEYLKAAGDTFVRVFPNDSAVVVSQSIDRSGFWPIRRVEYLSGEKAIHGAIQWRPGLQLLAVCSKYEGADQASDYDVIFRSVGTPNDATWQAEAEAAEATRAAAPPAPSN